MNTPKPTLEEAVASRFDEMEMPLVITPSETAAVNVFLRFEWVLIVDKRVQPLFINAWTPDSSATVIHRS